MKKSPTDRALKRSHLLVSPFKKLELSDAPDERDLADLMFDPIRPINQSKRATFHGWMQDVSKESHDCIYAIFQKKKDF